jgi:quercetin dioxygenase-like cupin family protein
MQVAEEKEEAKAGDAIFLPAQIPHGFFNTGKKTAVILLLAAHVDTVQ